MTVNSEQYHVSEIWIYPIKSLGGIRLPVAKVLPKGLEHDRRFMLIDASDAAITQRTHPILALFNLSIDGSELLIRYKTNSIRIPATPTDYLPPATVKIFDDRVDAGEVSREVSAWFSRVIGDECRLVFFPETFPRPVEKAYQVNSENVSLADAYPLLILGLESLHELNRRLIEPVLMNRFRPNIVFTGGKAFDEDQFRNFSIGDAKFIAVKPCGRCVTTTVNQETGIKGIEPLKTLATFRTENHKVNFGQNVLVEFAAEIKTGDHLIVTTYR
jgi:uncharacterized protein